MTFSLVARCQQSGRFGLAIASSSPAVAARCAHLRAGVGAVASQNVTDPSLGPACLDLMQGGLGAREALARLAADRAHMDYRQLLAVDGRGQAAVHSGGNALGIFGAFTADNVAAGGNLLADAAIPQIMAEAFIAAEGHLGERLLIAMRAAMEAGGEAGPIHSAGMALVDEVSWPIADLRIDWSDGDPIAELAALWQRYAPQMDAYVTRAVDPGAAPSYGVPGDE